MPSVPTLPSEGTSKEVYGAVCESGGVVVRPTITTSASPDYSANDVVGGIITLSSVMAAAGRSAILKSVTLKDASGQAPALTLLFFRATPAAGTYTDNGALAWGAGDLANLVGVVKVLAADWYTQASKSLLAIGGIDLLMGAAASDLFLLIVADATWNAASTSDLTAEFGFDQR